MIESYYRKTRQTGRQTDRQTDGGTVRPQGEVL